MSAIVGETTWKFSEMTPEKRSFLVTAPVEVELLEFKNGGIISVSPINKLLGSGNITEHNDGWSVTFRCNNDEFPLEGWSAKRSNCIEMIEKHIRLLATSLS